MSETDDRRRRGLETMETIHRHVGTEVAARLAKVSPAFADHLVDYAFGDVYARPGLDLRARQIATIAGLATLGNAETQLKWHIRGGLNVGLTRDEIIEILIQMALYGGFPAALRALTAAGQVFDELDTAAAEEARQDDA